MVIALASKIRNIIRSMVSRKKIKELICESEFDRAKILLDNNTNSNTNSNHYVDDELDEGELLGYFGIV